MNRQVFFYVMLQTVFEIFENSRSADDRGRIAEETEADTAEMIQSESKLVIVGDLFQTFLGLI